MSTIEDKLLANGKEARIHLRLYGSGRSSSRSNSASPR